MASRLRSPLALFASLVFLCLVASTATRAHPPHAPFLNPFGEDSTFAPITEFGPKVSVELISRGMTAPLKGVAAPGLPNHLFVVDQPGTLWIVDLNNRNPDTNKRAYLDVRGLLVTLGVCGVGTFDERGLLGVAFHPDFAKGGTFGSGKFYTYTSEPVAGAPTIPSPTVPTALADHQNVVREWQAATPGSPSSAVAGGRILLKVDWPQFNHDGGDLAFGPKDGRLYISMGDGGGADDADGQLFVTAPPRYTPCGEAPIFGHQNDGNGQKLNTPLGKILRIEVNPAACGMNKSCVLSPNGQYGIPTGNPFFGRPGAVREIWAFGLRNPYRMSFDRNGDLYAGDVGQNDIEELDLIKRGGNYGWNCKEGTAFFYINGSAGDDGFADNDPNRRERRGDCISGLRPLIDPIAEYDTHREGHSIVAGFVYHGTKAPALRDKFVFADFSLLFKFPRGPHDYGRLFTIDVQGRSHSDRQREIAELIVIPGGAVSLAVLGMGQDTKGEIYVTGNISGLPFPDINPNTEVRDVFNGRIIRLIAAEDERRKDKDDDDDDHGKKGGHRH